MDGRTPDGVLVRTDRANPDGMLAIESLLVLRTAPDVLMRFRQTVQYHRTIRDWFHWESTLEPGGHRREFRRADLPQGLDLPLIPSFARYLLVLELAHGPADWLEYLQVDEMDPTEPRHAVLMRSARKRIDLADRRPISAVRIDLLVEGLPATAYWCDDAGVVRGEFVQTAPPPIGRVTGWWWRSTWDEIVPSLDDEARAALVESGLRPS